MFNEEGQMTEGTALKRNVQCVIQNHEWTRAQGCKHYQWDS